MSGLGAVDAVSSAGWLANDAHVSLLVSLLTTENLKLAILGFYGMFLLGAFIQFFRYVILIPLLLRFGVMTRC